MSLLLVRTYVYPFRRWNNLSYNGPQMIEIIENLYVPKKNILSQEAQVSVHALICTSAGIMQPTLSPPMIRSIENVWVPSKIIVKQRRSLS